LSVFKQIQLNSGNHPDMYSSAESTLAEVCATLLLVFWSMCFIYRVAQKK